MNTLETENNIYSQESDDIEVKVRPYYIEEKSAPLESHFFFAYDVKIINNGLRAKKLMRRQWIIRNGKKVESFVNGEGVIGKRPYLKPGESFEYTSFCLLETPTGNMRGKFSFVDDDGNKHWAQIPLFFLRIPKEIQ